MKKLFAKVKSGLLLGLISILYTGASMGNRSRPKQWLAALYPTVIG